MVVFKVVVNPRHNDDRKPPIQDVGMKTTPTQPLYVTICRKLPPELQNAAIIDDRHSVTSVLDQRNDNQDEEHNQP